MVAAAGLVGVGGSGSDAWGGLAVSASGTYAAQCTMRHVCDVLSIPAFMHCIDNYKCNCNVGSYRECTTHQADNTTQ
jgi:hypothetical protein